MPTPFRTLLVLLCSLASVAAAGPPSAPAPPPPQAPTPPAWMGIKAGLGVRIAEVIAGGPAERAGLQALDIITAIGDLPLSERSLTKHIASSRPGDRLRLSILRGESSLELELQLAPWPEDGPDGDTPAPSEDLILKLEGTVQRAYLGLRAKEMSPGLATYLGLKSKGGVMVEHVDEGEAAEAAGLRAGDVLLEVDSHRIEHILDLERVMRALAPGEEVEFLVVSRSGKATLGVTLGSREKQIISMLGGEGQGRAPAGDVLLANALRRQLEALQRELKAKSAHEEKLRALLDLLPQERRALEQRLAELSRQLERMAPAP